MGRLKSGPNIQKWNHVKKKNFDHDIYLFSTNVPPEPDGVIRSSLVHFVLTKGQTGLYMCKGLLIIQMKVFIL